MEYEKGVKIVIPRDATPQELCNLLADISNAMSQISDKAAEYKAHAAQKATACKRARAYAMAKCEKAASAEIRKARVEIDNAVVEVQDELDYLNILSTLAEGEAAGYEAQFVAVRKIVEIRKMELSGGGAY